MVYKINGLFVTLLRWRWNMWTWRWLTSLFLSQTLFDICWFAFRPLGSCVTVEVDPPAEAAVRGWMREFHCLDQQLKAVLFIHSWEIVFLRMTVIWIYVIIIYINRQNDRVVLLEPVDIFTTKTAEAVWPTLLVSDNWSWISSAASAVVGGHRLFVTGWLCWLLIGWKHSPEHRQHRAAAGRRSFVCSAVSSGEPGGEDAAEAKQRRAVRSDVLSNRSSELPSAPAAHRYGCCCWLTAQLKLLGGFKGERRRSRGATVSTRLA